MHTDDQRKPVLIVFEGGVTVDKKSGGWHSNRNDFRLLPFLQLVFVIGTPIGLNVVYSSGIRLHCFTCSGLFMAAACL
jgi:hypothetical protein